MNNDRSFFSDCNLGKLSAQQILAKHRLTMMSHSAGFHFVAEYEANRMSAAVCVDAVRRALLADQRKVQQNTEPRVWNAWDPAGTPTTDQKEARRVAVQKAAPEDRDFVI